MYRGNHFNLAVIGTKGYVEKLCWVSSLGYPNLLGTKGYVVVVVVVVVVF
jgi:hypothetical protein